MIFTLLSSIWRLDPEYAFHLEGNSRQPELPEELLIEVPSSGTNPLKQRTLYAEGHR